MKCRHCGCELEFTFIDLGFAPPSNAYLESLDLSRPETYYPLRVLVCARCWLVQTQDYTLPAELFSDKYAYFSSTSTTWLQHATIYSEEIIDELKLNDESFVVEVASNDGYLLKNFVAAGIPCLGIEPTNSTASAARALGVPTKEEFFGATTAMRLQENEGFADLIIGNNVFAHVPDVNDFAEGLRLLLKRGGTITLEFPHIVQLIKGIQFDTIYHEHFSYFSFHSARHVLEGAGLRIFRVVELSTHGGSLRVYACHIHDPRRTEQSVLKMIAAEAEFGITRRETYLSFQRRADTVRDKFVDFLVEKKRGGKQLGAYGAAAKGNTLLNYARVGCDLVRYVCDAAPAKQGRFLPGSHIPIVHPDVLQRDRPEFILVLPWNIVAEVAAQQRADRWGGKYVTAIPELRFL